MDCTIYVHALPNPGCLSLVLDLPNYWWPSLHHNQWKHFTPIQSATGEQLRIEDWFSYILNEILQYIEIWNEFKVLNRVQMFRKIMQLNAVIILKSTNKYFIYVKGQSSTTVGVILWVVKRQSSTTVGVILWVVKRQSSTTVGVILSC